MENGKGALVTKLENNVGFGSTEFFVLRSNPEKVIPKLLFYFTKDAEFRKKAESAMTGTSGHRRVPKSFIEKYLIPDFTLEEQKQIVVEIEKIEAQIAGLQEKLAQIPQQKEAVLKNHL
jgi:restriction endonuclease S subunit